MAICVGRTKCTHSTHRGDAPSSPIERKDHCQPLVLLSQLSSKKSNKQRPLKSLVNSHWAWRDTGKFTLVWVVRSWRNVTSRWSSSHRIDERTKWFWGDQLSPAWWTDGVDQRHRIDLSFLFSAPDPQANSVECLYPVTMWSNTTLCWLNRDSGLIFKNDAFKIQTGQTGVVLANVSIFDNVWQFIFVLWSYYMI